MKTNDTATATLESYSENLLPFKVGTRASENESAFASGKKLLPATSGNASTQATNAFADNAFRSYINVDDSPLEDTAGEANVNNFAAVHMQIKVDIADGANASYKYKLSITNATVTNVSWCVAAKVSTASDYTPVTNGVIANNIEADTTYDILVWLDGVSMTAAVDTSATGQVTLSLGLAS